MSNRNHILNPIKAALLVTTVLFMSIVVLLIVPSSVHASYNQTVCSEYNTKDRSDLNGSIHFDYDHKEVTISIVLSPGSEQCAKIGGAIYMIPDGGMAMDGLNKQVLSDHQDNITIKPGETKNITLALPDSLCRVQVDGFVGDVINQFNYPDGKPGVGWYSYRLITAHTPKELPYCVFVTPTPTRIVTPTPTGTPSPTITPTPTNTPMPTPTVTITVEPTPTPTTTPEPTITTTPSPTVEVTPSPTKSKVLSDVDQLPETGAGYALLGMLSGIAIAAGAGLNEYIKRK